MNHAGRFHDAFTQQAQVAGWQADDLFRLGGLVQVPITEFIATAPFSADCAFARIVQEQRRRCIVASVGS